MAIFMYSLHMSCVTESYKSKTIFRTCDFLALSFGLLFGDENLKCIWWILMLQSVDMIKEVVGFKFASVGLAVF
jgi:hypothetical protein